MHLKHLAATAAMALALLATSGCDPQRISELEPGRSTEVDVRDRFGVPDNIWDAGGGLRTFEYNRQPAGQRNYMIDIGADGRLVAVRQVLTPENFARIQPGMDMAEVRRLLGKPAKVTPFELKNETHHDWRYLEAPNTAMLFTVVTDRSLRVLRTQSGPDMTAPDIAGGGRCVFAVWGGGGSAEGGGGDSPRRATPGLRPQPRHSANYQNNSCQRMLDKRKAPKILKAQSCA